MSSTFPPKVNFFTSLSDWLDAKFTFSFETSRARRSVQNVFTFLTDLYMRFFYELVVRSTMRKMKHEMNSAVQNSNLEAVLFVVWKWQMSPRCGCQKERSEISCNSWIFTRELTQQLYAIVDEVFSFAARNWTALHISRHTVIWRLGNDDNDRHMHTHITYLHTERYICSSTLCVNN